jgi:hypothetical protein
MDLIDQNLLKHDKNKLTYWKIIPKTETNNFSQINLGSKIGINHQMMLFVTGQ